MERDRGGVVEVVAARCARGSRESGDNEQERRGSGKGFRRERERDRQTDRKREYAFAKGIRSLFLGKEE